MATSKRDLEARLAEVRSKIRAGIDVAMNRKRERYLLKRLAELAKQEKQEAGR